MSGSDEFTKVSLYFNQQKWLARWKWSITRNLSIYHCIEQITSKCS